MKLTMDEFSVIHAKMFFTTKDTKVTKGSIKIVLTFVLFVTFVVEIIFA